MSHAIPASIFRAYDIRGIYNETLTDDSAYLIGRSIGSEVLAQGQDSIALARDGRLSGPALLQALSDGIRATGCHVVNVGMVPTPALYFATYNIEGLNSGVMLTGSHNPGNYNGFKIVINGTTLSGDSIQALRERIEAGNFAEGEGSYREQEILELYEKTFLSRHSLARPMKVVVDCGNGIAGVQAPQALAALGCEVVPLFTEVDGTFPNHHPDPGDLNNLQDLIATVKSEQADLGLAFDGDGDRVGVVTPEGEVVYPDILLMALAEDLVSRHPGAKVIFDVKCTGALFDVIRDAGGEPEMWQTGHSLIKARMKETGALLAGEMSGHIFLGENWFGFDDALVAAARILGIISRTDGGAEALFGRYPVLCTTPEININVTDENKFRIVEYLQTNADFGEGERRVIDGIRMDYADGWGLCRASNTSPKLVLRYEAVNEEALARIRDLFEKNVKEAMASA
ncbi:phosphomannomutase/phosphoglucomutase [Alcanivorax jadensis]|jgi:phosphomannomutase / phosphoglucomutase|uniref:phosphomannomutase/phosphoglucomutase n=1 Tax=Alcanivorax jadensis TaxID=64988 RepID=UPI0024092CC7|nr:phosphomannomutase/phosphoglucomutase [Alcanivorax jadensis]MDF1638702.1 phosphomannomutase/phosphoglucomutase [Alcanivorax jadensis]|tara:strand:+ start:5363 stop:6733 length:1371 start_codon:yes stop_codon:yes gene_type:complete